jgi:hypothetical protein
MQLRVLDHVTPLWWEWPPVEDHLALPREAMASTAVPMNPLILHTHPARRSDRDNPFDPGSRSLKPSRAPAGPKHGPSRSLASASRKAVIAHDRSIPWPHNGPRGSKMHGGSARKSFGRASDTPTAWSANRRNGRRHWYRIAGVRHLPRMLCRGAGGIPPPRSASPQCPVPATSSLHRCLWP